jgi:DNA polymerase/3'-5' exonuclease PolX
MPALLAAQVGGHIVSAGPRIPRSEAKTLALELVDLLRDACVRIEIAGSIRRGRAEVGDLDIVAIPHLHTRLAEDLFGQVVVDGPPQSALHDRCQALVADGTLGVPLNDHGHPKTWGPQLKRAIWRDLPVDILSTTWEQWGVALLLKTGPWEFSKRLVTSRTEGGACPRELVFRESRVRRRDTSDPLETPDEESVFAALGLEYVPPERRFNDTWPRQLARRA